MLSSALETTRSTHEDIERLKHLASYALQSRTSPTSPHARLKDVRITLTSSRAFEQLASDALTSAQQKSITLLQAYQDHDSPLRREMLLLEQSDPLSAFYARLRELRDTHRAAHSEAPQTLVALSDAEKDSALLLHAHGPPAFSGEEGNGRYLDLMTHYSTYLNLTASKATAEPGKEQPPRVQYYEYVRTAVTHFDALPAAVRNGRAYLRYLNSLLDYLIRFAERAYPLDSVTKHVSAARERIETELTENATSMADRHPSADALLQAMGATAIKDELLRLGLKCGGRPIDRATRLLAAVRVNEHGERVVVERLVAFALNDMLPEERAATFANVQKKLSLSYAEIEAERLADEAMEEGALDAAMRDGGEDEQMESTLYNPKDVPLGWDGKPIPYWMYKLHGLNHEFNCEICGNATYKGPRAFERHFTDTQHVHGLRCLGIGYSKEYMMITKIKDANALYEKLKLASQRALFDEDVEMEFEDREGNVLNKKTYNDLARQGLL